MPVTVVLNGTSSAGKSTLAEALRAAISTPLQISGIDTFLALQPESMFAPPDADATTEGFTWEATTVDGIHCWNVVAGVLGERCQRRPKIDPLATVEN
jgi:chloramphenicol 3-O-phosphotransferase